MTARDFLLFPGTWWNQHWPLSETKFPGYKLSKPTWERVRALDAPHIKEVAARVRTGLLSAGLYGVVGGALIIIGFISGHYIPIFVGFALFFLFMALAGAVESPKWNSRVPSWLIAVGPPFGRLLHAKPPKVDDFVLEICWDEIPTELRTEILDHARKGRVRSISLLFWLTFIALVLYGVVVL